MCAAEYRRVGGSQVQFCRLVLIPHFLSHLVVVLTDLLGQDLGGFDETEAACPVPVPVPSSGPGPGPGPGPVRSPVFVYGPVSGPGPKVGRVEGVVVSSPTAASAPSTLRRVSTSEPATPLGFEGQVHMQRYMPCSGTCRGTCSGTYKYKFRVHIQVQVVQHARCYNAVNVPDQGVGEALRRGWRARSGESALVLRTQSRREESERAAEAEKEVEPEAKTQAEEEEEVAAAASSTPPSLINLLLCDLFS